MNEIPARHQVDVGDLGAPVSVQHQFGYVQAFHHSSNSNLTIAN